MLDLGCGAGHYAAELLERGASTVVGVEGSESLLRAARERLGDGDRAPLHRHDLEEPLALPDFGGSYFTEDRVTLPFGTGHALSYRRMTLETFLGELLGAGYVLGELVEPRATEEGRAVHSRRYDKTHRTPTFLAVRLRRP
ncbi:class I SAM-dependent methyltransferase [Streptomyces sp. 3214.6]|uniref:class I SAM-dependent methyltransferase n=1 Tax=Streptomyces sp. 3214.6 TaxID=1882757 RepID=UPI001E5DB44B|nr:class I SAM-dependent methyltransferase [Streptomyces sp. 3214.6]